MLGFLFAAFAAKPRSKRNEALQDNLAEARKLRAVFVSAAKAFVQTGDLSATSVANALVGRGSLAEAKQLVALASLFRTSAARLAGRSPITAAMIAQASQVGTALETQLTPKGAGGKKPTDAASDLRDRFYTLLVQGHDPLWRVGAVIAGEAGIAAMVPPLLSHGSHTTLAGEAAKAAKGVTAATAKATKAAARAAKVKPKPAKAPKK